MELSLALLASLPALYSQVETLDPIVHIQFVSLDGQWTWLVIEGEPCNQDFVFYGYVYGVKQEWTYFSLAQLTNIETKVGGVIHRDIHFAPEPFSRVVARTENTRARTSVMEPIRQC